MYRIVAIKRDGRAQTWEPVTSVFTDNPMPTADIHTKRAEQDKDGIWRDTSGCDTVRFFKQDERSFASIDKTVFSRSLDLLSISMQTYQMMELTYLSSDTKEWLRELSTKITNVSNELCRLKEQIKEEYYNDVQDTEN